MLNENAKRSSASRIWKGVGFFLSLALVAASIWVVMNRQLIADYLVVASFTPSEQIAYITSRSALTDTGKRIFYATQPAVSSPEDFNKQCPRQEAGSPILGCYTAGDRIFIYNLTNDQLDGMEEVTAVHELLHAVWQRTSAEEQERLSKLLNEAYMTSSDPSLKTHMDYYQRTEPDQINNELHSILGTEVAQLPEELETYYAQYFDRPTIIAHHQNYSSVYTTLTQRSEELYATMESLSDSIEQRSQRYSEDITVLDSAILAFNTRAQAGDFSSTSSFYAERSQLLARSQALETTRQAINADISQYDEYYQEYQKIASEIQVLNDSTDSFSQLEAAPSL